MQLAIEMAPDMELNFPALHAIQELAEIQYVPAEQIEQAVLPNSYEKYPVPHVIHGKLPFEKLPGLHAKHSPGIMDPCWLVYVPGLQALHVLDP
jgi:hypothetical protein